MSRLPAGLRILPSTGAVACAHRDVSCCDPCAAAHPEVVECLGAHYWTPDEAERNLLITLRNETAAKLASYKR